jgi:hypothetical protein
MIIEEVKRDEGFESLDMSLDMNKEEESIVENSSDDNSVRKRFNLRKRKKLSYFPNYSDIYVIDSDEMSQIDNPHQNKKKKFQPSLLEDPDFLYVFNYYTYQPPLSIQKLVSFLF